MDTLIVIGDENPGAGQGAVMSQAKAAGCEDLLFVKAGNKSALNNAFQFAAGKRIILLNGTAFATTQVLAKLNAANREGVVAAIYETSHAVIDFVPQTAADMYYAISNGASIALLALSASKDFFTAAEIQSTTPSLIIAELMLRALSQREPIRTIPEPIDTTNLSEKLEPKLNESERASLLQLLLKSCNVEDIFPAYSWDKYSEESAALCFHKLAGVFMRLGDANSANECLEKGDLLEDSPRSLALKGIICERSGKTLEAVAQMVSSLQRYEVRKKENDNHYVNFNPRNIERINASLHAGLEALNKRDNQRAFECFSRAVFDFDPFYEELGLAS